MSDTPLLDYLRAHDPAPPWFLRDSRILDKWRAHRAKTLDVLRAPELPARNIDRITRHHFESTTQEYFDLRDLTFPPAFGGIQWLEYPLPERIHSEVGDQDFSDDPKLRGHAGFLIFDGPRTGAEGNIPEDCVRVLIAEIFLEFDQPPRREGPHGSWAFAVDAQGKIIGAPAIHGFQTPAHNKHVQGLQPLLQPALMALAASEGARPLPRLLWDAAAGKSKVILAEKKIKTP